MHDLDIEKIKRRDAQAFRELAKLLPHLRALARGFLGRRRWRDGEMISNEPDDFTIDEYAYDALFEIYDSIHEYGPEDGDAFIWCRRVGLKNMRERPTHRLKPPPRFVSVESLDRQLLERSFQRLLPLDEGKLYLDQALDKLTRAQRSVFQLRRRGCSYKEIACALSISETAARKRYFRAIARLKNLQFGSG